MFVNQIQEHIKNIIDYDEISFFQMQKWFALYISKCIIHIVSQKSGLKGRNYMMILKNLQF